MSLFKIKYEWLVNRITEMVSFETYHISHSIYKHGAIDIAYPSSMQDASHMNFVIDLAHRSLCGSVVEHQNAEQKVWGSIPHGDSFFSFFFVPR